MKHLGALILFVFCASFTLRAQENAASFSESVPDAIVASSLPPAFTSAALVPEPALDLPASPSASLPQVTVQSVFRSYSFQLYGGYTFVRFYAYPQREVNRNGFDIGVSYFYHSGLLGAEGSLTTTFGSISGERSDLVFAGGGPRFRWSVPRGIEIWAHGLVGAANFGPRIAGFGQDSLGYEVGGGIDVSTHRERLAYRFEADMIGTRLYNVTQYSPKLSAGIVFKF